MTQPDPRLVKASMLLRRDEVMLRMLSGVFADDRWYMKLCGGALYFVHVGNLSLEADLGLKIVLDSSKHIEKIAHNPRH